MTLATRYNKTFYLSVDKSQKEILQAFADYIEENKKDTGWRSVLKKTDDQQIKISNEHITIEYSNFNKKISGTIILKFLNNPPLLVANIKPDTTSLIPMIIGHCVGVPLSIIFLKSCTTTSNLGIIIVNIIYLLIGAMIFFIRTNSYNHLSKYLQQICLDVGIGWDPRNNLD